MFDHHRAMVYHTPETALIHKEETMSNKARTLPDGAVQRTRYTCRDRDGNARLCEDVDIMDAIEQLARIEERGMGVLIQGPTRAQQACADNTRRRWQEERLRREG